MCIYISINNCVKHGKLVNPRGLAMGFERNMIERNSGPKGNNKKSQKPGHLDKLSEILIRVFLWKKTGQNYQSFDRTFLDWTISILTQRLGFGNGVHLAIGYLPIPHFPGKAKSTEDNRTDHAEVATDSVDPSDKRWDDLNQKELDDGWVWNGYSRWNII